MVVVVVWFRVTTKKNLYINLDLIVVIYVAALFQKNERLNEQTNEHHDRQHQTTNQILGTCVYTRCQDGSSVYGG